MVDQDEATADATGPFSDRFNALRRSNDPRVDARKQIVAAELFGDLMVAAKIGRYTLVRELGSGAMGIVYLVYDDELDRRVALKLLHTNSSTASARLRREAQAMAQLSHPNVVTVHEVGAHGNQTFIAMEYVDGLDLRSWLAAEKRGWREVVDMFAQAGAGLVAAHAAHIVHRDFKPDNVLVGSERARVADFGLAGVARSLEFEATLEEGGEIEATLTRSGVLMGTPAYMAPEVYEGRRADALSDQFSFCVALWEGLYGQRPFSGRTLASLRESVVEGRIDEPPPTNDVPGWLRKVIERGLASSPEARHSSMSMLLAALTDDPRVRRRRWLSAVLTLGLVGGGVWGAVMATHNQPQPCANMDAKLDGVWDDAQRDAVETAMRATGLAFADDAWTRTESRLDAYADAWVEARVAACEATVRNEQSGELLDRRMACLDRRLEHMRALVDELSVIDAAGVEHAITAAADLPGLESCANADALMSEVPPPDDPELAARVAEVDARLIAAIEKLKLARHADLEALAREAEELGYEPLQARIGTVQGNAQDNAGEYVEAEKTLERALNVALAHRMRDEASRAALLLVFVVGARQGRLEDARRWCGLAEALARAAGTDAAWATYLNNLGLLEFNEGNYEASLAHFDEAVAIHERNGTPERATGQLLNSGRAAQHLGRYDEARNYQTRAYELSQSTLGPDHPDVGLALNNLGMLELTLGNFEAARSYLERAIGVLERAHGPMHADLAHLFTNLGVVNMNLGELEAARINSERAQAIRERSLPPDHPDLALCLTNLGIIAMLEDRRDAAREYYARAQAIRERSLPADHPDHAYVLINLGALELTEGNDTQARELSERGLALVEKGFAPTHIFTAEPNITLGAVAERAGDHTAALGYYTRAAETLTSVMGPDARELAQPSLGVGRALLGLGRPAEAVEHIERAVAILTASGAEPVKLAEAREALTRAQSLSSPSQ